MERCISVAVTLVPSVNQSAHHCEVLMQVQIDFKIIIDVLGKTYLVYFMITDLAL